MKKCLKRLLQCSIVLLLFNCQSEDLALDSHEHKQLKITEKTFEELMADSQFKTAFAKIPKGKSATSNSLQARTVMEAQYGFTIADTPAKVIETDNKISYTLLISREEENNLYFENLIIQVDSTNQTKAAVVKYISGQDMPAIENAASFEAVAEITPIIFDASVAGRGLLSCISISTSKCNGRPWNCGGMICGFNTDTYCVGGGGPGTPATPITYISTTTNPGSSGGGGGGESTSPNHGTTNPTPEPEPSNPQNPADNFGNLLTTPVKPSPKERFISSNQDWLDDNPNEGINVIDFLDENGYTEENRDLIQKIIVYHQNNPQPDYTQNNYPGQNDDLPYQWWEDDEFMEENLTIFEQIPNGVELLLFSIFPDKALLHKNNSNTALDKARELFLNGTLTGITDGRADAFRHAYWNALDTAEIGSILTEIFTDAHEAFSSGLSKQMDLYNNEKGREKAIAMHFNFFTSDSEIASSILIEVYIGHLVYILSGVLTYTN